MAVPTPTIECTEGEAFTFAWTVKRNGSVVDLTGFSGVLYMRDNDAAVGTNRINGVAVTITTPASGVITFAFSATHTALVESTERGTHIEGQYTIKLTKSTTDVIKFRPGKFLIHRDPFIAAT